MKKNLMSGLLALLLTLSLLLPAVTLAEDGVSVSLDSPDIVASDTDTLLDLDISIGQEDIDSLELELPGEQEGSDSVEANVIDVTLAASKVTLGVKETFALSPKVSPSSKKKLLSFTSSKPKVAKVDAKTGKITALKTGQAIIYALIDEEIYDTCKVTVKKAPLKLTMNAKKKTLKLGDAFQLSVTLPKGTASNKITWNSSNKKVAKVNKNGLVSAMSNGKATITAKTYNGKVATCVITVKTDAIVYLDQTSLNMIQGDNYQLIATTTSPTTLVWTSDNPYAASVSQTGLVTASNPGSANIVVTTADNHTATCFVTVSLPPITISLDRTDATIEQNQSLQLNASTSRATTITWSSSDNNIAIVSGSGLVTGINAGTAVITATTAEGTQASCTVKVTPPSNPVTYRALLVGETWNLNNLRMLGSNVSMMNEMLRSVKGPEGSTYIIEQRTNLTRNGLLNAINNVFFEADDNDVSLFYISTAADNDLAGDDAGRLWLHTGNTTYETITMSALRNALLAIPGQIIVILESDSSGSAIYAPGVEENSAKSVIAAAKAHNAAVIKAFSDADPGITANGGISANTGEFRTPENKFYVLTATNHHGTAYGDNDEEFCYFTKWLTQGIGTSGKMLADTRGDANGTTTLNELFNYISFVGNAFDMGNGVYQHVQVYPKNSNYGLFIR